MSISTLDQLIASARQRCSWAKTTTLVTVAGGWFSMFAVAGDPGVGTLAGTSTAAGVVPTDATAGYPAVNTFGGGATGYLTRAFVSNTVAGTRVRLYDRLFLAGAYAFNANTALAAQPSYSGRLPVVGGSPDYNGLEIWVEQVTAATGNQAVNVTYTNQSGTAARTTGATGIAAAPTVGRCWQLPLQAGDSGVQKVDNVAGSVATAGTFNVMVLRPLFDGFVANANDGRVYTFTETGMLQVYDTSALYCLLATAAGVSSGTPLCEFDVANG